VKNGLILGSKTCSTGFINDAPLAKNVFMFSTVPVVRKRLVVKAALFTARLNAERLQVGIGVGFFIEKVYVEVSTSKSKKAFAQR
jgi:hypothetical protein